jgi:WD40 repeat protein/tetratricopeptide (TPR) repeat protein
VWNAVNSVKEKRMTRFSQNALVLAMLGTLALLAASCVRAATPIFGMNAPALATVETPFCALDKGAASETLAVSPDGRHTAYTASRPDKWFVAIIDGVEGKRYDAILTYYFSVAKYKDQRRTYFFSPDSKRVAYIAQEYRSLIVVVDGVESAKYDAIYNVAFSPDSKHYAFDAKKGDKVVVVLDGVEGKEYDYPEEKRDPDRPPMPDGIYYKFGGTGFIFSPDSNHLAYSAVEKNKAVIVLDGREVGANVGRGYVWQVMPFSGNGMLVFSPDSSLLAYIGYDEKGKFVVMDSVDGNMHDVVRSDGIASPIVFSPDSKHVAYMVRRTSDYKCWIVFDGVAGKEYAGIEDASLTFSPDSSRLAYIASVEHMKDRWRTAIILDGEEVKDEFYYHSRLIFSPDSKHLAYVAGNEKVSCVVLDGKKGENRTGIDRASLMFSPDSQHLAYRVANAKKACIVLDEKAGREYGLGFGDSVVFSPDSKHLAYLGDTNKGGPVLVLDGAETAQLQSFFYYSPIVFPAPDKCRVYIWKVSGLAALEVTAPGAEQPPNADATKFAAWCAELGTVMPRKWNGSPMKEEIEHLGKTIPTVNDPYMSACLPFYRAALLAINGDEAAFREIEKNLQEAGTFEPELLFYELQVFDGSDAETLNKRLTAWDSYGEYVPLSLYGSDRDDRIAPAGLVDPPPPSVPKLEGLSERLAKVGDLYAKAGLLREAVDSYIESIYAEYPVKPEPKCALRWAKIAEWEMTMGRPQLAVRAYLKALGMKPENPAEIQRRPLDAESAAAVAALYRQMNLHPLALQALASAEKQTGADFTAQRKEIADEWAKIVEIHAKIRGDKCVILGTKAADVKDWTSIHINRPSETFWKPFKPPQEEEEPAEPAAPGIMASEPGQPDTLNSPAPKPNITETPVGKTEGIIVNSLAASPDSRHVAWIVQRGDKKAAVVDGIEGKQYEGFVWPNVIFSPDSKHVMYAVQRGDKRLVVADGVEGKEYDDIVDTAGFLADGACTYIARAGAKYYYVVDGVEVVENEGGIKALDFFGDERRIYIAQRDKKSVAVVDGVEGKECDYVGYPVFSADMKHYAYSAVDGSKAFFVIDGVETEAYEETRGIMFSPDSKRVAYVARLNGKEFLVIDGVKGKEYDYVIGCIFSPDSKRVAYRVMQGKGEQEKKGFVVIDGVEGKEYEVIIDKCGNPYIWWASGFMNFSPDSKRVAYAVKRGETMCIVVDGKEGTEYAGIANIVFSPDSGHMAYIVGLKSSVCVVVDGVEGKGYLNISGQMDYLYQPLFSPDSKHVVYLAQRNDKDRKWCVVVDGAESGEYDELLRGPQGNGLSFDSPAKFHVLAKRGDEIILVEIEITE